MHIFPTFYEAINQIDKSVNVNNNSIKNLKIYEKQKINSFSTYGASEWQKYFTDRYKK